MPFAVVDLDGCLIDDVHETFAKFLRRENSRLEFVFKEVIFNALDRLPNIRNSVGKNSVKSALNKDILKALKILQDAGIRIVVRTANGAISNEGMELVREKLLENSINATVEYAADSDKCKNIGNEKPVLVLDDKPDVAANASRKGIKSILILGDYNRVAAGFLSRISNRIIAIKPEDTPLACKAIAKGVSRSSSY